jgi:hypothetical protein
MQDLRAGRHDRALLARIDQVFGLACARCGGEICIFPFATAGPTVRDIGSTEQGGCRGLPPHPALVGGGNAIDNAGLPVHLTRAVNSTRTLPSGWERRFATTSTAPRRPLAVPPARSCIVSARPLSSSAPTAASQERSKLAGMA